MRKSNRYVLAQGSLAGLALLLLLGVAAEAIQSPLGSYASSTDRSDAADVSAPVELAVASPKLGSMVEDGKTAINRAGIVSKVAAEENETYTGTLLRKGSEMVLREESGKTYRLDGLRNQDKWNSAATFEGRPVKVTGKREGISDLIHVTDVVGQST